MEFTKKFIEDMFDNLNTLCDRSDFKSVSQIITYTNKKFPEKTCKIIFEVIVEE